MPSDYWNLKTFSWLITALCIVSLLVVIVLLGLRMEPIEPLKSVIEPISINNIRYLLQWSKLIPYIAIILLASLVTSLIQRKFVSGKVDAAAFHLRDVAQIVLDERVADAEVRSAIFAQISREQLQAATVAIDTLARPEDTQWSEIKTKIENEVEKKGSQLKAEIRKNLSDQSMSASTAAQIQDRFNTFETHMALLDGRIKIIEEQSANFNTRQKTPETDIQDPRFLVEERGKEEIGFVEIKLVNGQVEAHPVARQTPFSARTNSRGQAEVSIQEDRSWAAAYSDTITLGFDIEGHKSGKYINLSPALFDWNRDKQTGALISKGEIRGSE